MIFSEQALLQSLVKGGKSGGKLLSASWEGPQQLETIAT